MSRSIYLDNSATSFPKPPGIIEFASEFYRETGVNIGRGKSKLGSQATSIFNETRYKLSKFFDIDFPECIIFSPSASIALNQLIFGIKDKQSIYYTPFEHNSVLRPIHSLSRVELSEIPFNRDFTLDYSAFDISLSENPPDLLVLTQTSNVCGFTPPLNDIIDVARDYNSDLKVIVDGAQASGTSPLDIKDVGVDYYVFSGHKSFFAGYGIAGWVMPNPETSEHLSPFLMGGTGTVSESLDMPDKLPSRFEVGSHNLWAISSLYKSIDWLNAQNREDLITHPLELARTLATIIEELPGSKTYIPPSDRWYPIVSFTVEGVNSNEISNKLADNGIATRSGFHCAPLAHKWLGTEKYSGTVRLSPGIFNTKQEILEVGSILTEII